ncbi:class I SAM-dependent methyltransferase [Lysobacter sp. HDW10]|uniref:class I SAM-dependent methyltransferase n=1 Tax=Lysobacter sp. HDW10 TaxID=2714936 RepID=UPI00140D611F|nr:methyltransferase [Lysobacter sp. HDW10]QIK80602.1 class I SAM-dependent methyltransferase [Lysobacter sp. HDW10]
MNVAAHALLYPFETGRLPWPASARVCLLNADELHGWQGADFDCVQTFKPLADVVGRRYGRCVPDLPEAQGSYDWVLVLPPRTRAWSRALLAQAALLAKPDGQILISASNDEGGKSHAADLKQLLGDTVETAKHKCRVAWGSCTHFDKARAAQWIAEAAPKLRTDGLWTQAGVFSADGIDPATAMLLAALPTTLSGAVADFGAGVGVIAKHIAQHCTGVSALALYEADARALAMARKNLEDSPVPCTFHWADVTREVEGRFDVVVSNPPFHAAGKKGLPELGQQFITVAAKHLSARGSLWLVANAHLPYESVLSASFQEVETVHAARNYKVIKATGPRR